MPRCEIWYDAHPHRGFVYEIVGGRDLDQTLKVGRMSIGVPGGQLTVRGKRRLTAQARQLGCNRARFVHNPGLGKSLVDERGLLGGRRR